MKSQKKELRDSEGNIFYVKDLMKIFSMSNSYVNLIIRENGFKTIEKFAARVKVLARNCRPTQIVTDRFGTEYKFAMVAEVLGRSRSWVTKVARKYNFTKFEEYEQFILSPLSLRKENDEVNPIFVRPPNFNRGKFCFRENFMIECEHYASCADARIAGGHHERFKADGSCFSTTEDLTWCKEEFNVRKLQEGSYENQIQSRG